MSLKVKLQIAGFVAGIVSAAVLGVWLAIHYDSPGFLLLCVPAFAAIWAGL